MTIKTMLLSAAMTGALMVPVYAVAADATKPAEPAKTEAAAPAADASKTAAPAPADASKEDRGAKMFAEFDANKDGSISEDEFLNHKKVEKDSKWTPEQIAEKKKERFKEIDTDKDGKVSEAEFKAFGEKMKAQRAERMEKKADAPAAATTDAPKPEEKQPAAK